MATQQYSFVDRCVISFDLGLRSLLINQPPENAEPIEQNLSEEVVLTPEQKKHTGALMRINHCGEISAQGLYAGQAIFARDHQTYHQLIDSALEESDHLSWCYTRMQELDTHKSYLNWFWLTGSFMIGMTTAALGDRWSLGFVIETENQVVRHLRSHLKSIHPDDQRTKKILNQMIEDETRHAIGAARGGGRELPVTVRYLMQGTAKLMTSTAYYL